MFMHTQMDERDDVDKNTSNKQVVDVLKICLTVNLKQYTPFYCRGTTGLVYIYIAVAQVRLNLGGTKGDSINNSTLDC